MWRWTQLQRHFPNKIRIKNKSGHPRSELKNVQVVALDPAPAPHAAIFLIRVQGTWTFGPNQGTTTHELKNESRFSIHTSSESFLSGLRTESVDFHDF